jgi:uncharacterized protein with FMN-binding domain
MRRTAAALLSAFALAAPAANAVAATPKKKVTVKTKTVTGPAVQADRWGTVQVTVTVRKTTTTIGTKKTVKWRITAVNAAFPDHTDRSVFINQQALPMLVQETLSAQFDISKINVVGGATDTSYGFGQSLQAALLQAKKV